MGRREALVEAAGGVLWRAVGDDVEILLVHRPKYDDWSLPKGKLLPGESYRAGAQREILEETGLRCELGVELAPSSYIDRKGRPKIVRYWAMTVTGGRFRANLEVDVVRWVTPAKAARVASYERDLDVIASFVEALVKT